MDPVENKTTLGPILIRSYEDFEQAKCGKNIEFHKKCFKLVLFTLDQQADMVLTPPSEGLNTHLKLSSSIFQI